MNRSFFERIAHSLIFGQKMSDSLGNQMSEFLALRNGCQILSLFPLETVNDLMCSFSCCFLLYTRGAAVFLFLLCPTLKA